MIIQNKKAKYCSPIIERILLDNAISLSLQSFGDDPLEPGLISLSSHNCLKSDPYQNLA